MTTIQINREQLLRACADAGIVHTVALRIFTNLTPAPAGYQYKPEYKTLTDHNGRINGVRWVNIEDRPPVGTASQVSPAMALPSVQTSTFTPDVKPLIPTWQIDLQYRSEQPDWPKPWRLKQMTIKNSRAEFRRTDFFDTFEQAVASIPKKGTP